MGEKEHEKEIHRRWEGIYRETPAEQLPWERPSAEPELVKLVEKKRIPKGSAVLDVCCGQGRDAVFLAIKGFKATGIDISETALARARKRARQAGAKVRFVRGIAWKLPFRGNSFSFANDRGCFHHVPPEHREQYAGGLARVLKPGSLLLVQAFSSRMNWANSFTKEELIGHFKEFFKPLRSKEIVHREAGDGETVYLWSVLFQRK